MKISEFLKMRDDGVREIEGSIFEAVGELKNAGFSLIAFGDDTVLERVERFKTLSVSLSILRGRLIATRFAHKHYKGRIARLVRRTNREGVRVLLTYENETIYKIKA